MEDLKMRTTALALVLPVMTVTAAANSEEWTFGPSLNVERYGPGACVAPCGTIYVVGGKTGSCCPWGPATGIVEALTYDEQLGYADAWTMISPLNAPRVRAAVVCTGGFLYVIGGGDGEGSILTDVERLDLLADDGSWEDLVDLDLPIPISTASGVVDDWGRIWVIGVSPDDEGVVQIYDPSRPDLGWTQGPPLTVPRTHNCGVEATRDGKGRIYVLGGCTSSQHLPEVERIDPCDPKPAWELVADIPDPVSNTDTAILGADGRIYVVGGWLPGFTDRVIRYDPDNDDWEELAPLNVPRNNIALVLGHDGRIFTICGVSGSPHTALTSVEILTAPCGAGNTMPLLMDEDANGTIDVVDFLALLANWGCGLY
jgi:hypothetical protein